MNRNGSVQNHPSLWIHALPQIDRTANKYTRGHAMIIGGYPMTGAARLAARASARIGAGLTTIAVPELAFQIYATALVSIMVEPLSDNHNLDSLIEDKRISAFLIGPGAGITDETRMQSLTILGARKPVVIDAGAITCFQDNPSVLFNAVNASCVLTPHEGEFDRIFSVEGDRITKVRAASELCGCIIILKGCDTVVAHPDGRTIINSNAPPTLATAGSGDVLSGIVLGLIAQGMDAFLASAAAVWIHGAAANAFGIGLIAEDLPDLLPLVLGRLNHFKAE